MLGEVNESKESKRSNYWDAWNGQGVNCSGCYMSWKMEYLGCVL